MYLCVCTPVYSWRSFATYPFIALDALGHLPEIVVVGPVDVAKVADLIARRQAGQGRRPPWGDTVDPGEGFQEVLGDRVPEIGRPRRLSLAETWTRRAGLFLLVFGVLEAREVLVEALLNQGHEVLVVVA